MSRLPKPSLIRNVIIAAVVVFLLFLAGIYLSLSLDPLVEYYGNVLRESALMDQTETSLYCQQLASFSFGPNFACFNSQQELDVFAASR